MLGKIILILFYLLSPAVVLWACNRSKILGKIGPVLVLYFLGFIIANLNLIPADYFPIQDTLSTIAIPLALPMMLYSCDFKKFSVKTSLKITILGVVAVVVMVILGNVLLERPLGGGFRGRRDWRSHCRQVHGWHTQPCCSEGYA